MMLNYHKMMTSDELFQKYDESLVVKKLHALFKKFPNRKVIRIFGEENQNKFIDYFNSLDDFEKMRYCWTEYHAIPMSDEHPCSHWQWVLDVKFRTT